VDQTTWWQKNTGLESPVKLQTRKSAPHASWFQISQFLSHSPLKHRWNKGLDFQETLTLQTIGGQRNKIVFLQLEKGEAREAGSVSDDLNQCLPDWD
jgi:hypothetical protein